MELWEQLNAYLLGTASERRLLRLRSTVRRINETELQLQTLPDAELQTKTTEFRQRLAAGENLDHLLVEAFAVVKNACRRLCGTTLDVCGIATPWDMIPFDEQILAGIVLHRNGIAEMATGEGKTLAAAMPLYLNALGGRGAHLVTVNDYLARRDSEWIGCIFRFLGMTVGCIQTGQSPEERREAYLCDITYGVNSEFGFDYLRDNGMATAREEMVQRELDFAIIDEIDSVLIDEARTPLIIAGEQEIPFNQFDRFKPMVQKLVDAQQTLSARLFQQAAAELRDHPDSRSGLELLLQIRLATPGFRPLEKMLEDSGLREKLNAYDDRMHNSTSANELTALKSRLFYVVDEKHRQVEMTARGYELLAPGDPDFFVLPDHEKTIGNIRADTSLPPERQAAEIAAVRNRLRLQLESIHDFMQLMQAYCLFDKDVHYVIDDGKILIVDEHTGRALPGRRFNDGLHQALEAKENVRIEPENITYASITQQNYFRLYRKLAGMTGTASTEAGEFYQIYKLEVTKIPTHRPVRRLLHHDLVFRTRREKFQAIADEVERRRQTGQPVLLGTPSVEDSEMLSRILQRKKIPHRVLNAKQNLQEAEIIAHAGELGQITVATNMAGRGTDIKLAPGVAERGGLLVIGSSRHDARRIDLQLQGRCARQGDPGESQFYVALEDEFMRLYGPENAVKLFAASEEPCLAGKGLDKIIENAQKKLEIHHYAIRKRTLDYDDVMNRHRTVVYAMRREIIDGREKEVRDDLLAHQTEAWERTAMLLQDEYASAADRLVEIVRKETGLVVPADQCRSGRSGNASAVLKQMRQAVEEMSEAGDGAMPLRFLLLEAIEREWILHLNMMEQLVNDIYLVSYGERDPLVEYKKEAYVLFEQLMDRIAGAVVAALFRSGNENAMPAGTASGYARRKTRIFGRHS